MVHSGFSTIIYGGSMNGGTLKRVLYNGKSDPNGWFGGTRHWFETSLYHLVIQQSDGNHNVWQVSNLYTYVYIYTYDIVNSYITHSQ